MKLVIQQCNDWTHSLLVDKDSDKVVVRFEYDDQAMQAMEHVVKALKYAGIEVGEEDIPEKAYVHDANGTILREGVSVVTVLGDKISKDWLPEAHQFRKFGMKGTIIKEHNSHGLCFDVRHSDGSVGCYDPWELVVVK
jgi:uncharacterized Zn ribbon protein